MTYYTKTETDTTLSGYPTVTYLYNNYMTPLLITQALTNNYAGTALININFSSKTDIDPTPSDPYYTKSEIDTTLNLYSPPAQILNICHSKLYIDNTFIPATQTGTLYYNKTETGNMILSYSTGSYVDYNLYTKTETDTLLADKVTNIGDIDYQECLTSVLQVTQIHE